jgi:hypothetical protein
MPSCNVAPSPTRSATRVPIARAVSSSGTDPGDASGSSTSTAKSTASSGSTPSP